MYRGMTAQVSTPDQPAFLTALLILDVTNHVHFFETLQRWFWFGLVISALVSAALGWVVARSGLRPLRQVTFVATSMSARSLKERIPLEPVPLSFSSWLLRLMRCLLGSTTHLFDSQISLPISLMSYAHLSAT